MNPREALNWLLLQKFGGRIFDKDLLDELTKFLDEFHAAQWELMQEQLRSMPFRVPMFGAPGLFVEIPRKG